MFLGGIVFAASRFDEVPGLAVRILWVLFAIRVLYNIGKAWYWPTVQYRYRSWILDDIGIQVKEGVLHRAVRSVPRSRVQHLDLSQGYWERSLNLATLTINTAARANAAVVLQGVTLETATRIRDYLLPRDRADAV